MHRPYYLAWAEGSLFLPVMFTRGMINFCSQKSEPVMTSSAGCSWRIPLSLLFFLDKAGKRCSSSADLQFLNLWTILQLLGWLVATPSWQGFMYCFYHVSHCWFVNSVAVNQSKSIVFLQVRRRLFLQAQKRLFNPLQKSGLKWGMYNVLWN